MKSQVNALLYVVGGILTDVQRAYPELKDSLSRDRGRLTLYCQSRGEGLFTLDLPHLESLLLSALETGRLILEGPLSKRVSSKTLVPKLYSGLWLRIFDRNSCLKQEPDVNAIFFLRQLLVIGKRIEVPCSDDRIAAKIGEYHDIERKLRRPSFSWQYDEFRPLLDAYHQPVGDEWTSRDHGQCDHDSDFQLDLPLDANSVGHQCVDLEGIRNKWFGRTVYELQSVHLVQAVDHVYSSVNRFGDLFHEEASPEQERQRLEDVRLLNQIQKVADLIFGTFDSFDPIVYSDWLLERGEGIGFRHGPGAVAEKLKQHEKSCFPNWPAKLDRVFPYETCGKTIGSPMGRPSIKEVASRLICVPKTAKGPRLIAAEPDAHQWCQQLILRFLFNQCKTHFGENFIDFRDQSKSGRMVYQASSDRKLATVDLSDASDRLSCWTVERMLRSNETLLSALHAARTRYTLDENLGYRDFLSLRKFASQGTATTFPVMSLVMLCIALGSTLSDTDRVTWARLRELRTKVRVFGDDIILPTYGYERLVRAMELLQLKVNMAKSYIHGHFRESCGSDGFKGYDITPSKPKTLIADSPASCQAVVDTSNNLFNKGLWNASRTAELLLPVSVRNRLRIVGRNDAGFSGFTSYTRGDERHLEKRWNSRLHRYEVKIWQLSVKSKKTERGEFDGLLDFFARAYSSRNPRVVSEYVELRTTKSRLLWEPQNTDALSSD